MGDEEKKNIEVRGLKWGEKLTLKEEGFDFHTMDLKKDNDDFVNRVVRLCAADPGKVDNLDVGEVYAAFWDIVQKTFPRGESKKNSDGLPSLHITDNSGDAEPVKETD